MTNMDSGIGVMKPVKSRKVSRTKCKQRFNKPRAPKPSKVKVYFLAEQYNLPATDKE